MADGDVDEARVREAFPDLLPADGPLTFSLRAGGWHLIGQTPLRTFDPKRDPVFLFDPGDRVCFEPISHADFQTLSDRLARGEFRPEPEEAP